MAKMTFRSCNKCYWCRYNYMMIDDKLYELRNCRMKRKKAAFKFPKLHGWFCKYFRRYQK